MNHFKETQKNAKFSIFKTCKLALAGQSTQRPPARPEHYCESKQRYFIIFSIKPCHGKLSGAFLLRLFLNGLIHRKPTKCNIHGHFCLISGNIVTFTNLNPLILTIIVAKLNFCVKMAFHYDVIVQIRSFLSFNNFKLNITKTL